MVFVNGQWLAQHIKAGDEMCMKAFAAFRVHTFVQIMTVIS